MNIKKLNELTNRWNRINRTMENAAYEQNHLKEQIHGMMAPALDESAVIALGGYLEESQYHMTDINLAMLIKSEADDG